MCENHKVIAGSPVFIYFFCLNERDIPVIKPKIIVKVMNNFKWFGIVKIWDWYDNQVIVDPIKIEKGAKIKIGIFAENEWWIILSGFDLIEVVEFLIIRIL